jgi:hypothetical protein
MAMAEARRGAGPMNMQELVHRNRDKDARVAGLLYLVVVVTGMYSLAYVPSHIAMSGDASTVVQNLTASESLFRSGIAAAVVCYIAFLLLPIALYRLLGTVATAPAVLMVAFALASVPISFANLTHRLDVLSILDVGSHLRSLSGEQLHAQVMLSLDAYRNGLLISEVFWGLWLLPFGYLVFKSGFLPRLLGILLMAGCFGYLIDVFGHLLWPGYAESAIADYVRLPAATGEIGTCLWLLIAGARWPRTQAASIRAANNT